MIFTGSAVLDGARLGSVCKVLRAGAGTAGTAEGVFMTVIVPSGEGGGGAISRDISFMPPKGSLAVSTSTMKNH